MCLGEWERIQGERIQGKPASSAGATASQLQRASLSWTSVCLPHKNNSQFHYSLHILAHCLSMKLAAALLAAVLLAAAALAPATALYLDKEGKKEWKKPDFCGLVSNLTVKGL